MTLKKWLNNLRFSIAIKISNLFLYLSNVFVKKEDPDEPRTWLKNNFNLDSEYIVKLMTLCDVGPFYSPCRKTKLSDEEYKDLLETERKESIKLHTMFKSRLVPHFNPSAIERHNECIKNFQSDFNLAALMKREEKEGEFVLSQQGKPMERKK